MPVNSYDLLVENRGLRVLLADLQEHVSYDRLADHLYSRHAHELTVADLLVIRPPVDQAVPDIMPLINQMSPVFERVPKLPIHLLTSNNFAWSLSGNIQSNAEDVVGENARTALTLDLRRKELATIARRSKAIMQADGATIFRTPSKSYCYRFLRAANVQISRATMDIFFFWMLPWLENCHAIVAESWTISSIVLNATRLLARYAQGYSRCKVELLADYYDGSAEAEAATEIALERVLVGTSGVVLVAFSACMTGNAVSGLRSIVERYCHGELSARFGSLYNLQPDLDIECLCELFRELPPESFRHYAQKPTDDILVIDIDRTTYFPSVITEVEIGIDRACAKPAREFFQSYGTAEVFSVHRNSYVAGQKVRHHAIYTDIEALLAHPAFTSKLSQQLAKLEGRPSLIITPPHDPGRALARFAEKALRERDGGDLRTWEHLDLAFPQEPSPHEAELREELRKLDESSSIVVLDDVSVTGRRLSRYSKSLRGLFRGQIHYIVGLARPEQPDAWTKRVRDLVYRHGSGSKHTVNFIEFLLLPDWDEACCPWCAEQAVYRNLILAGTELPAVLARRNAELARTNTSRGWSLSPFIGHPANSLFDVGENSIFAPVGSSPATTYAAVASACQELRARSDPTHNLAVQLYPQVKCLRYLDYLGNTFTDPVLRSSFLRAAHRRELERVSTGGEAKRAEAAKALLLSPDQGDHCIAIELLLASRLQKLPRLALAEVEMQAPHLEDIAQVLMVLL